MSKGSSSTPREHAYMPELRELLRKGEIGRREFLRTATLLGVSSGAAYTMAGRILGEAPVRRAAAAAPKKGGSLRIAMQISEISDPATYDFVIKSNISRGICEYLTRTNVDNITEPYLAKSWEASDDLKVWTFHLHQGIKWNNGDDFTADDVVFNFKRWIDPQTGSSNKSLFSSLSESGIEKVDDHTVRLHLDQPQLAIPENLFNYPTAIVHRNFEEWGGNLAENPVGTGPFNLVKHQVAEEAILRRRDDYWGRPAYLDEVRYIDIGEDPSAGAAAMASDQVDLIYEIDVTQLPIFERIPGAVVHEKVTAQTGVARMQVDKEPFTDIRVRKAIVACMDHEECLRLAYQGRGQVGENHHVGPIHPEYAKLPPLKPNVELAKQLLEEAGYPDGIDLEINVRSSPAWELNAMQTFRQQLQPAGINLKLNVVPSATFWETWDKVPFGFTFWTHRPLGVMVLNLGYRSGVAWNESNYSNPEFDKALDEASAVLDPNERREKMVKVEKILQDDAVIGQPLWRSVFSVAHEKVQGYETHPTLYHRMEDVWLGT